MSAMIHENIDSLKDSRFTFAKRPLLVYWEMTRACDLACQHCRAEAMPQAHPLELKTEESKKLLRELAEFGSPLPNVVMTGGDPLKRSDLWELIAYGQSLGLPVSLAPSGTELLTTEALEQLKEVGIVSMSLSIDGSNAESHDSLRGVPGCFERTVKAAETIRRLKIPLQINTLVTRETMGELFEVAKLCEALEIMRWSLFFLIEVGRGKQLNPINSTQSERLFHRIYEYSKKAPFAIKTTEAMHYRRIVSRRMLRAGATLEEVSQSPTGRGFGIRDGNGIMFISHIGAVCPSGFLPLSAGNVRVSHPVGIYRNAPLFRALRLPDLYSGKCGECEYRFICGGSRSRAYAATGSSLGSDPLCPFQPRGEEPAFVPADS